MEPLTHVLSAVTLYNTGLLNDHGDALAGIAVVTAASLIPDVDALFVYIDLRWSRLHRALTHSLLSLIYLPHIVSIVFYGVLHLLHRPVHFPLLYLLVLSGICLHLLLDSPNSFGTQFLYPFTRRNITLDLNIIFDPYLTALFLVPILFAASGSPAVSVMATLSFSLLFFYFGLLFLVRMRGERAFRARGVEGAPLYILPKKWNIKDLFNPFSYYFVLDRGNSYVIHRNMDDEDPLRLPKLSCGRDLPSQVKDFILWARFPHGTTEEEGKGKRFRLGDLRFYRGGRPYLLDLLIGPDGEVVERNLRFF